MRNGPFRTFILIIDRINSSVFFRYIGRESIEILTGNYFRQPLPPSIFHSFLRSRHHFQADIRTLAIMRTGRRSTLDADRIIHQQFHDIIGLFGTQIHCFNLIKTFITQSHVPNPVPQIMLTGNLHIIPIPHHRITAFYLDIVDRIDTNRIHMIGIIRYQRYPVKFQQHSISNTATLVPGIADIFSGIFRRSIFQFQYPLPGDRICRPGLIPGIISANTFSDQFNILHIGTNQFIRHISVRHGHHFANSQLNGFRGHRTAIIGNLTIIYAHIVNPHTVNIISGLIPNYTSIMSPLIR